MKVSKASSYAMHAVQYMVRHFTLLPVANKTIAKAEGIPSAYLAKIMQKLSNNNILVSCKKNSGGYLFARSPEQISVMEVLETIEGKDFFDECFMKHCDCGATTESCGIFRIWRESTKNLKETLEKMSLVDSAWTHPQHYFDDSPKKKRQTFAAKKKDIPGRKVELV